MKNNFGEIEKRLEEKHRKRKRKIRPKMAISGKSVLALEKIIRKK